MEEPKKVKIIESTYYEEKDVVEWLIEFVDNKNRIKLVWPSTDLGIALGIEQNISPEQMKKFCKDIKGKEINLVMEADIKDMPSVKDMNDAEIDALSKKLDKYPFFESIEIQEKNRQK